VFNGIFEAMTGNRFGKALTLTTFGESHGPAIGGILEGFPAGVSIDLSEIQTALNKRRPGQSALTTQRKEADVVQLLSGVFEGRSTGAPIGFTIPNSDAKSKDYEHLKDVYRPSHADFTFDAKYGFRDYRGGGRASARETAARVVGGALAKMLLPDVQIQAYVSQIHHIATTKTFAELDLHQIENTPVRCPDPEVAAQMMTAIAAAKNAGDSLGGVISCVITGVPAGWGEPVFDKIHADLGKAMLSINAVKGFEIGSGFAATRLKGSEHNDAFLPDGTTRTNHSGGVQGGITNGQPIFFTVAFKPTATIHIAQETVNTAGEAITLQAKGRHDPCVLPRAVPIVEAMAALVLADHFLRSKTNTIA
jgi:chorismate synthase